MSPDIVDIPEVITNTQRYKSTHTDNIQYSPIKAQGDFESTTEIIDNIENRTLYTITTKRTDSTWHTQEGVKDLINSYIEETKKQDLNNLNALDSVTTTERLSTKYYGMEGFDVVAGTRSKGDVASTTEVITTNAHSDDYKKTVSRDNITYDKGRITGFTDTTIEEFKGIIAESSVQRLQTTYTANLATYTKDLVTEASGRAYESETLNLEYDEFDRVIAQAKSSDIDNLITVITDIGYNDYDQIISRNELRIDKEEYGPLERHKENTREFDKQALESAVQGQYYEEIQWRGGYDPLLQEGEHSRGRHDVRRPVRRRGEHWSEGLHCRCGGAC